MKPITQLKLNSFTGCALTVVITSNFFCPTHKLNRDKKNSLFLNQSTMEL